jgi:hypothetical protein
MLISLVRLAHPKVGLKKAQLDALLAATDFVQVSEEGAMSGETTSTGKDKSGHQSSAVQ